MGLLLLKIRGTGWKQNKTKQNETKQNPQKNKNNSTPKAYQHHWTNVLVTQGEDAADYHSKPKSNMAQEAKQNDNDRW